LTSRVGWSIKGSVRAGIKEVGAGEITAMFGRQTIMRPPWGHSGPTPEERRNGRTLIGEREREYFRGLNERYPTQYKAALPDDFWERRECQPYIKIASNSEDMPRWAKRWNGQMKEDSGGRATTAGTTQNRAGQRNNQRLYYRKIERGSLTDAMAAMGLLAIRKRVIPIPIKRIMKLKI
jgi:hypothetical protein